MFGGMMSVKEGAVTFQFNKITIAYFCLLFSFAFGWMIYTLSTKHIFIYNEFKLYTVIGLSACLFTIIVLEVIGMIPLLFSDKVALVINESGVYYQRNYFLSYAIPWDCITEIKKRRVKLTHFIIIKVEESPMIYQHLSTLTRLLYFPLSFIKFKTIVIKPQSFKDSFSEIYDSLLLAYNDINHLSDTDLE